MRNPEITLKTKFGNDIVEFLKIFKVEKAIEIGSGSGNGSTQCFIKYFDSINNVNKKLYCFEPVKQWFDGLVFNTKEKDYCKLYNSSAISYEDFLIKDFEKDFYESDLNILKNFYDKKTLKSWYEHDMPYFKNLENSILPTIEADAVLIDGCEFSGYSEFKKLHNSVKIIFLDDCFSAFKNKKTFNELNADQNWQLMKCDNERNGYAIFRKIK